MVAYCTKPRWGTRLIPAGALRSVTYVVRSTDVFFALPLLNAHSFVKTPGATTSLDAFELL